MVVDGIKFSFVYDQSHGKTICKANSEVLGNLSTFAILSRKDKWNKRTGRKVAFGRMVELVGLTKEMRTTLWNAYLAHHKL